MQTFTPKTTVSKSLDASNDGWGAHLVQVSTKGLWSDREKRLHIIVLQLKVVSLALKRFKDQCQNQTVLVATDNSTVVAYINKQGGTHLAEMCALLWKIMTWCHLFTTRLNHKVPLYVSPVSDQHAYPSTALLHRVIQKVRQCNCLIIVIAPGWPGMP